MNNAACSRLPHRLSRVKLGLLAALLGAGIWTASPARADEAAAVTVPAPVVDIAGVSSQMQTAVLAGGCFWGVQGVFQHVEGVVNAESGYAGGTAETANYNRVGRGDTGHAEAVRIVFDPRKVSYGRLLQIYFSVAHDPTDVEGQGADRGPQYRSAVFPVNAEQDRVARHYIDQLNQSRVFELPIATTVESAQHFYQAEAYHQDFLALNPTHPYIVAHDLPKIDSLKRLFPVAYRVTPVLVGAAAGQSLTTALAAIR